MSEARGRPRQYSDAEILDHIRRVGDGEAPTQREFDADGRAPSTGTARNRFGSWRAAVTAAGFEARAGGRARQYTDTEILDHIRRLGDGEAPTAAEFDADEDAPSMWTVRRRFESWDAAVTAAGFETRPSRRYTDDELLDHIRRVGDGAAPTAAEFDADEDAPGASTVARQFGSWREGVAAAGLEPRSPGPDAIPREELIEWLLAWRCEFGVWPRLTDLREWPGPNAGTYRRAFGGVPAAIEAAKEVTDDE